MCREQLHKLEAVQSQCWAGAWQVVCCSSYGGFACSFCQRSILASDNLPGYTPLFYVLYVPLCANHLLLCEHSEQLVPRSGVLQIHAYVQGPNGRTRYLSELRSGEEVVVVDATGRQRTALVGRVKIEARPLVSEKIYL